jgi:hypothetical protein
VAGKLHAHSNSKLSASTALMIYGSDVVIELLRLGASVESNLVGDPEIAAGKVRRLLRFYYGRYGTTLRRYSASFSASSCACSSSSSSPGRRM